MSHDSDTLKSIATLLLEQSGPLHNLYSKACILKELQQTIEGCLPAAMTSHVKISSYRNNDLHLIIDNAHWATRLRYIEHDLIKKLKSVDGFHQLNRVRYSVRPSYTPPLSNKTALSISVDNAKHIASVAKNIEDEQLRKALIKLSKAKPRL
jgi:hypothetical protein